MAAGTKLEPDSIAAELGAAELGDARRSRRLEQIVQRVAARPDASFPQLAGDDSELEGVYRFLTNEHVSPDAIIAPHFEASVARASALSDPLVVHDTTYFRFEGERAGLGRVHRNDRGFWGHFALAVDVERRAHGLVGWKYGTRHGPSRWSGRQRVPGVGEHEPSETLRWPSLVDDVRQRFGARRVVHVMDREADWFELLTHMQKHEQRFVVRLAHDRLLDEDTATRVSELWQGVSIVAMREVPLSARAEGAGAKKQAKPERAPRVARLEMRATGAQIRSHSSKAVLPLNIVRVLEIEPPDGCEPVVWTLLTTEPVATEAEVLRVVDIYRARWVIEEFFKALKTGCAFEKRQLGSYAALLNALAMLAPVAWFLLRVRDTGRRFPGAAALEVIDESLLDVLKKFARAPMPREPTARDVMYAIAGLGGHLRRNGDPGWMTLARGMERLLDLALGAGVRAPM